MKIIGVVLGLVALVWLGSRFPIGETLAPIQAWFRGHGLLGIGIYAGLIVVLELLLIPCLPLTIAAGAVFGFTYGSVAIVLGNALAAAAGFLVARHLARAPLMRRFGHHPRFESTDEAIRRRGWMIVGLLRLCPLPFGPMNYLYGLTAIDFTHYLLATVIAMFPGNLLFVYLGSVGKKTLAGGSLGPVDWMLLAIGLTAFVAVGFVVRRVARDALGEKA